MSDVTAVAQATTHRPPVGLALRSLLRADTVVLLHNRVSSFVSILVPVAVLVVTGFGARASRLGGADLTIGLALTVGLITSCLLGYALGIAQDRDAGVLQRLRVTPAPTWAIMASRLIVQVAASLIVSVIVVVVAVIVHGLDLSAGQIALVLAVAVLGSAVFLSIAQALVGLVNSVTAVNAIGRVLFILLVFIGLVGVTGLLGDVVQAIAVWTPVGALMILFSDVLLGAGWALPDTYALLACGGYIVIFAFIGIRWFRWNTR